MTKVLSGLIGAILLPIDFLISQFTWKKKTLTAVIRMDQIGDFLLSRGLLSGVITTTPNTVLILNSKVTKVAELCFPGTPIFSVNLMRFRLNIIYRFKILYHIRKLGILTFIHPVYSRHHFVFDAEAIIRASGAPNRIGFLGEDLSGLRRVMTIASSKMYTRLVDTPSTRHDSLKYNDMSTVLKIPIMPMAPLVVSGSQITIQNKYVIIFPIANSALRQWPAGEWIQLCRHIASSDTTIIMCGDTQSPIIDSIKQNLIPNLVDLVGKTTVTELVQLLSGAQWVCGVDGGGIHLAAAVGCKTVAITGGGHWGRFLPYPKENTDVVVVNHKMACYGCRWTCIYPGKSAPCVTTVSHLSVVPILLEWSTST